MAFYDCVRALLNTFRVIILRQLLLLTNLDLKLLSTQETGADKILSTQRVKPILSNLEKYLIVQHSKWKLDNILPHTINFFLARLDKYFVRYLDLCQGIDGLPSEILALMLA